MLWSQSFDPSKDLLDLTSKVILVTGGNHGIGYSTVKHLARKGAKVYLGARNEEKGKAAIARLNEEGIAPENAIYFPCDISTPSQAKQAAEDFMSREDRLDVLVNNAALLGVPGTPVDQIMMVNHFSTLQLTLSLLPLLKKTSEELDSDVRIVAVNSMGHRLSRGADSNIQFKTFEDFNKDFSKDRFPYFSQYCFSKLAILLAMTVLQKKLATTPITVISVHPGTVDTFSDRLSLSRIAKFLTGLFIASPDVGAYNSAFAAASPLIKADPRKYKGAYLNPVGVFKEPGANARREDLQEQCYETTEKYLASLGL
ncbi:hypothetical protein K443DRAFT_100382 [Laccaria amethystina LaAM-08-1]|uniref:NAD(P)-binding protein n=1 Tax=Laccaria amethystina LaAM-08-1 TaxID=1095629 RepID=A0A0C9WQA7_9AGAR|nr:hypothetical protein K443DRAFT_100382 [Laccaria amethystina LaAM-08-1]